MLNMVDLTRKLYPKTVIIVDNYDHYYIYGRDAYIVYYLTGLSIKKIRDNKYIMNNIDYLNFLLNKLNKYEVSYVVVVKRMRYNVELERNFNNSNYISFYTKGKLVYKRKEKIKRIKNKLKVDVFSNKDKIYKIRRVIDENL